MPAKGKINPAIRDEAGKLIPWKKRNREASNASARTRRAKNPEKVRKQNRDYRERNPFNVAVIVARKRAKDLGVLSTLTKEEWEEVVMQHQFKCHLCGELVTLRPGFPETISLDHLLPMSRGGNNVKYNVAPAHRRCNQSRLDMTLAEFDEWLKKVAESRNGKTQRISL